MKAVCIKIVDRVPHELTVISLLDQFYIHDTLIKNNDIEAFHKQLLRTKNNGSYVISRCMNEGKMVVKSKLS